MNNSFPETETPAGILAAIQDHNETLWGAIDSDANPFLSPMKTTTRERLIAALKANQELTSVILRRYFEQ